MSVGPIAVTGATGYVASHVVRELLERGHTVHATARDPSNPQKVGHLQELDAALPGTLKLFAADLLEEGAFDDAVADCEVVIHTASPFLMYGISDPEKSLIQPALTGTRNVLGTVDRVPSVQRVVLTSSVLATYGDPAEAASHPSGVDEACWNEASSVEYLPYAHSKVIAEREAWKLHEAQDRWSLVVINPGFVMGPSLTARRDSASIETMLGLVNGKFRTGHPDICTPWVDVRDVATAHVEAAVRPDAEGRHLLSAGDHTYTEVVRWLSEDFPEARTPRRIIPRWLAYVVMPPNGFGWKWVKRHVGIRWRTDTTRSRERLGLTYRPVRETVREHVEQLKRDGLWKP